MTRLELFLLGSPRAVVNGQSVEITERKALALLAYAAVAGETHHGFHRRDTLATLLWPEVDGQRARANLRYILWLLKTTLGAACFAIEREGVALHAEADVWVDVGIFQELLSNGRPADESAVVERMEKAVSLYRGDFLAGFTLADSPQFDEWQFFWSEALRGKLATALEKLARHFERQNTQEKAIECARRWLALDALHEPAHRQLMRLYAQHGQRSIALHQYEECVRLLHQELGIEPEDETVALHEAIRTRRYPPATSEKLEVASQPAGTGEITSPQTGSPTGVFKVPSASIPFIGREHELAQIDERLAMPSCRLLTILGPGGMGKSRLAVEAAHRQAPKFVDGVCFIPLATLESHSLLAATIMQALNVPLMGTDAPEVQLINHIRKRKMLLILDNYEQLLPHFSLISEILAEASGITLLVTSRERLQLDEEWLLPLDGLSLPDEISFKNRGTGIAVPPVSELERYSAIRFFVQCVQRLQPAFALNDDNRATVLQLCRILGGMPLGIELAAGWTRAMSLTAIAQTIERNLESLSASLRNRPERHRSMQAVFDHSWRLLSAQQRTLLRQISVFRGSFSLDAAIAVAGADVAMLLELVDRSWLRVTPSGHYEMHELVRQYAAGKLATEHQEATQETPDAVRDRHSSYYGRFSKGMLGDIPRTLPLAHGVSYDQVLAEIDNIWAAWHWAIEQANLEVLEQCISGFDFIANAFLALHQVEHACGIAGLLLEQRLQQGQVTAAIESHYRVILAEILGLQANMLCQLGHQEKGKRLCEHSLDLLVKRAKGEENQLAVARVKLRLTYISLSESDYLRADRLANEALLYFRQANRANASTSALHFLSMSARFQGRFLEAERFCEEIWAIGDPADPDLEETYLELMGAALCERGDYAQAEALRQELQSKLQATSLRGNSPHADLSIISQTLGMGELRVAMGRFDEAREYFEESLQVAHATGYRLVQIRALNGLGAVALATGEYQVAAGHFTTANLASEDAQRPREQAIALNGLGETACMTGNYDTSRSHFMTALHLLRSISAAPVALASLVGLARLFATLDYPEKAVELLALVIHHPAATRVSREKAESLLAEFSLALPSNILTLEGVLNML